MRLVNNVIQTQNLQQRVSLEIEDSLSELEDIVDTFKYHRTDPRLIKEVKRLMIRVNNPKHFFERYIQKNINFLWDDQQRFTDILKLAAKVHETEDRESGIPYVFHAFGTGTLLARLGMPIYTIYTGLLHDIIESPNCTKEDIKQIKKFGQNILLYLQPLTAKKIINPGEKDKDMYKRIELFSIPWLPPKIVKGADGYLNLYDIDGMKEKNGLTVEERKDKFIKTFENNSLNYAREFDQTGLIRIKEDDEIFSLEKLYKEKINEKK
jgi:(p)ppGpp synthase/HD superfamily hydrolase